MLHEFEVVPPEPPPTRMLDEGEPTLSRPLGDRRLADPHELSGLTGTEPHMLVVWWLVGSDRATARCCLPLALPLSCGLAASNRQGAHLVAVEGAPDTGLAA